MDTGCRKRGRVDAHLITVRVVGIGSVSMRRKYSEPGVKKDITIELLLKELFRCILVQESGIIVFRIRS